MNIFVRYNPNIGDSYEQAQEEAIKLREVTDLPIYVIDVEGDAS